MIRVRFRNANTAFSEHWIVQDENNADATVLDRVMAPEETYPNPAGGQWLFISSPNGTYGDVQYISDNQNVWSHKSLISDGDTVDLF